MSKMKNILITGASGAVGSEILKQISNLTDQYKVTIFDLKTKESINCFRKYKHSIEIVYGDIAQNDEVENVCHDKDFVIHLAAIIPPRADKFPA